MNAQVIDTFLGVTIRIQLYSDGMVRLEDNNMVLREDFASIAEALKRSDLLQILDLTCPAGAWLLDRMPETDPVAVHNEVRQSA